MASAARDLRYRQAEYSMSGSLAYDLDWAVRERELRHAGEAPRHKAQEPVREAPQVRTAARTAVRQRQHVSLLSLVGVGAVVGMAILMLMGYVQLTVLSEDTVALKEELEALKTENVTLTAQYEQMFDLATVREAAEAAGMGKPSASQVYYLDLSGGDSAVVYQKEAPSILSRVLTTLNHSIYAVVEYFD